MRYRIKERCAALGVTMRSLRDAVMAATGEKLDPSEWSCFVSGAKRTPKAERILEAAVVILEDWERRK